MTHSVEIVFVGGPADGARFTVGAENFEEHEFIWQTRDGHLYQSDERWDGIAARVMLYHRKKRAKPPA